MMDPNSITRCEIAIQYTFSDKLLAAEALNNAALAAATLASKDGFKMLAKNDRLAVYGDLVAATTLCKDWYSEGSSKDDGKAAWTSIRCQALSNSSLAQTGFSHGLQSCINKDPGTRFVSNRMMATAVEAILGAVHLDGGDVALRRVLETLGIAISPEPTVLFVKALGRLFGRVT